MRGFWRRPMPIASRSVSEGAAEADGVNAATTAAASHDVALALIGYVLASSWPMSRLGLLRNDLTPFAVRIDEVDLGPAVGHLDLGARLPAAREREGRRALR